MRSNRPSALFLRVGRRKSPRDIGLSKLRNYIDEASEFDAANYQIVDSATGEVIKIDPAKVKTRTVKLAIPSGNWSAGQLNALKRAKEYGLSLDPPVQFEFHVIP